jgi:hypothetical protein
LPATFTWIDGGIVGKQSRQTQRERERAEKAAAEAAVAHRRRRRPYWIGGGVLALVLIVLVVVLTTGGGSSTLPPGTQVFAEPNHQHVTGTVHYNRTPPAGGKHNAEWLNCGVYSQPVPNENAVHDLEHGAVWVTYQPSLSAADVLQLQQYVETHYDGTQRYLTLSPYPGLPAPVVASAWGAQLRLTGPGDPRLGAFISHYIGGNQGGEKGAPCTGGVGTPIG